MTNTNQTTLVSLFHTQEHAQNALSELQNAGITKQYIQTMGGASSSSAPEQTLATLKSLNLPPEDLRILSEGLTSGGTLIVVRADQDLASKAQSIFERQDADQIDERSAATKPARAVTNQPNDAVIPVVEEQLVVGKRNVQRGGVKVFTRVVETPVEEEVILREERATLERRAVNRPISEAELNALGNQSIEVTEMGEEAVVGKTARVVEEVRVGKEETQRTQRIKDTVRKTEVEVDETAAETNLAEPMAAGGKKS